MATSTYFSFLSQQKTSKVVVGNTYIETMYGKIPFEKINDVYFEKDQKNPMLQSTDASNINEYLIIEQQGKMEKPAVLSEKNFDIKAIKLTLDEKYAAWRKKEEN